MAERSVKQASQLFPKSLFLFGLGRSRRRRNQEGAGRPAGRRPISGNDPGAAGGPFGNHRVVGPGRVPTGDLRRSGAMKMADFHRLRAGNEDLGVASGATGRGDFARFGVDVGPNDSTGSFEAMDIPIPAMLVSPLHELRPDGQGAVRSLKLEIAIIVEADPHDAKDLRSESGEPGIAVRARLAGRRNEIGIEAVSGDAGGRA